MGFQQAVGSSEMTRGSHVILQSEQKLLVRDSRHNYDNTVSKSQILGELQTICEALSAKEPDLVSGINGLFLKLQNYYHRHIQKLKGIVCEKQEQLDSSQN